MLARRAGSSVFSTRTMPGEMSRSREISRAPAEPAWASSARARSTSRSPACSTSRSSRSAAPSPSPSTPPRPARQLADNAVAALGDRAAVLLRHHGVLGVGRDLEEAVAVVELVERVAKMRLLSLQLGAGHELPADDRWRGAADVPHDEGVEVDASPGVPAPPPLREGQPSQRGRRFRVRPDELARLRLCRAGAPPPLDGEDIAPPTLRVRRR